jgi:sulfatase modifying factor 1
VRQKNANREASILKYAIIVVLACVPVASLAFIVSLVISFMLHDTLERWMTKEPAFDIESIEDEPGGNTETAPESKDKTLPPGMKLISIPGGTFSMGYSASEPYDDESQDDYVTVDGFKLSETEVTIAQYVEFLNASRPSNWDRMKWVDTKEEDDTSHIYYSGDKYYADPGWEDHPVTYVSWYGAEAFCEYYGLRFPTETEWEYAARGPNHYEYPWGNEFDGEKCCYYDNKGSGNPPTMPVKSFEPNGYRLYDMAGNVWEWCSDEYDSYLVDRSTSGDPPDEISGDVRIIRGGSWRDESAHVSCAARYCGFPRDFVYFCGFRCAAGN